MFQDWEKAEAALDKMRATWVVGYSFHDSRHEMTVNFQLDRAGHY